MTKSSPILIALIAITMSIGIGCGGSTLTSPTPPAAPPPAPPVSVTFNLQIVPAGTARALNGTLIERQPPLQRAELRVRGSVQASDGSATVVNRCTTRWGDYNADNIEPFAFTQTVSPGSPFTFDRTFAFEVPAPAPQAGGSLRCTLEVRDEIGRRVDDFIREVFFNRPDVAPPRRTCVPDARTLCAHNDRIEVRLTWRLVNGVPVPAEVRPNGRLTNGGFFYFSARPDNEIFIRVLDRCLTPEEAVVIELLYRVEANLSATMSAEDTFSGFHEMFSLAALANAPDDGTGTDIRRFSLGGGYCF